MAYSGAQITRLAPHATPTRKNGAFSGKTTTEDVGPPLGSRPLMGVGK